MSLDLPSDDLGPDILITPRGKKRRAASKSGQAAAAAEALAPGPATAPVPRALSETAAGPLALPSDDEEGQGLEGLFCTRTSSSTRRIKPKGTRNVSCVGAEPGSGPGDCESDTLKKAAMGIPSRPHMPFDDLRDLVSKARPYDSSSRCTLWEVFSVPRLGPSVRSKGGQCRRSYDLRNFWDLTEESFQRTLIQDVCLFHPLALMLSPPCTFLCQLMHSNWSRMDANKRLMSLTQGCNMVDFCCWLAEIQIIHGCIFALEHPAGSLAWQRASVA